MSIERTFTVNDVTPLELAEVFCGMFAEEQAEFFSAIKRISDLWAGAGWCQQCSAIAPKLDDAGQQVIAKLSEWASDPNGDNV